MSGFCVTNIKQLVCGSGMIFILVGGYIMFFCVIDESFHLFIYFLETSMYDQKSYVSLKTMNIEDN